MKNLRVIRTRRASGWCEPEREDSEAKFELRSGEKRSYGGGCGCGHTFHHVKEWKIGLVWRQDQLENIHIFFLMVLNMDILMCRRMNM